MRVRSPLLRRLLDPRSVAVVGASEGQARSDNAVQTLLQVHDVELHLVNPNRPYAYGRPTVPSLAEIGSSVDAVLCLVNAERSVEITRAAADAGAGGIVVIAGGFRESGDAGARLEQELRSAAAERLALCGPNCNGFINGRRGIRLCGSPPIPLRTGGIGLVTHSGGAIALALLAARERRLGFSYLISTGNEAALDLVDVLEFLIDDPETRTICLLVERIERPAAFVEAAERARAANKPVIALRQARGDRARAIAQSHAGAILAEGGDLDAVFATLGVVAVTTVDDLFDATTCFEQLEPARWRPLRGVGILTASGGAASLASDYLEGQAIPMPELADVRGMLEGIPHASTMNPLDLTGFVLGKPDLFADVVRRYVDHPELDAIVLLRGLDRYFRRFGGEIYDHFAEAARTTDKAMLIASMVDSRVDGWVDDLPAGAVARARGLRALASALKAMDTFARAQSDRRDMPPKQEKPIARPADVVASSVGDILPFATTMELLLSAGVPVAPYLVVEPIDATLNLAPPPAERYVVKIAEAPHRTEIGGIRLNVTDKGLTEAIDGLRAVARAHGLPQAVVVQPQLEARAEGYLGIDTSSPYGSIVVCGVGGIHVELGDARSARLAPVTRDDAVALIKAVDEKAHVLSTIRGRAAWDADAMTAALVAIGRLHESRPWLRSLDINPIIFNDAGVAAVDALCIVY